MKNVDIVFFGNDWFGENKTSSHHIASKLSEKCKVLYVECPGLRSPRASKRDFKKIFSKLVKCFRRPLKINDSFYVFTLFQFPFINLSLVRSINNFIVPIVLKMTTRSIGIKNPILWFMLPHLTMILGKMGEVGSVYYCIDNYAVLPDVDRHTVESMDSFMTARSDIVFVASEPMYSAKEKLAHKIFLSPHGVDFDHFHRCVTTEAPLPSDLDLPVGPVIGFWGLIEGWIDLNLIRFLAQKHVDWSFVMIGHVAVAENPCEQLTNVYFIGKRNFVDLPSYARLFDVGILPYKLNDQVYNCNPIKLREYLSAGLPVVSVRFPEVENYSDVVFVADDYSQFNEMLETALSETSDASIQRRVDRVRSESWDSRVETIYLNVKQTLNIEG